MIIRYATKPDTNGNTFQLEIDTEKKRYYVGGYIFTGCPDFRVTKKEIRRFEAYLTQAGYTLAIRL